MSWLQSLCPVACQLRAMQTTPTLTQPYPERQGYQVTSSSSCGENQQTRPCDQQSLSNSTPAHLCPSPLLSLLFRSLFFRPVDLPMRSDHAASLCKAVTVLHHASPTILLQRHRFQNPCCRNLPLHHLLTPSYLLH